MVLARTGDLLDSTVSQHLLLNAILLVSLIVKENKLEMRSSETSEMVFDNCRIHESQVIGEVGEGFIQAMKVLDGGRMYRALSLGIAKALMKQHLLMQRSVNSLVSPLQSSKLLRLSLQIWLLLLRLRFAFK